MESFPGLKNLNTIYKIDAFATTFKIYRKEILLAEWTKAL